MLDRLKEPQIYSFVGRVRDFGQLKQGEDLDDQMKTTTTVISVKQGFEPTVKGRIKVSKTLTRLTKAEGKLYEPWLVEAKTVKLWLEDEL